MVSLWALNLTAYSTWEAVRAVRWPLGHVGRRRAPGRCFSLRVDNEELRAWIMGHLRLWHALDEGGPLCARCAGRVSVEQRAVAFVMPGDEARRADGEGTEAALLARRVELERAKRHLGEATRAMR